MTIDYSKIIEDAKARQPGPKQPSVAELQESIDKRVQAALLDVVGRPFTMETIDDLRLKLAELRIGLIDMDRERSYVDERAYAGVCYQLNYFRLMAAYLMSVCRENGFDFTVPDLPKPTPVSQPSQQVVDPPLNILEPLTGAASGKGLVRTDWQVHNAQALTAEPEVSAEGPITS